MSAPKATGHVRVIQLVLGWLERLRQDQPTPPQRSQPPRTGAARTVDEQALQEVRRALLYYNEHSEQTPDKGFVARRALLALDQALGRDHHA